VAPVVESIVPTTTGKPAEFATCPVAIWHLSGSGDLPGHLSKVPESERGESEVVGQLSFCTKRFAIYVGRRCRDSSIQAVAAELHVDWRTVKPLDMQYMREQL